MANWLNWLTGKKRVTWDFNGGIHPPEMKLQSSTTPLRTVPLPHSMIIPVQQHVGSSGDLCVKTGDRVLTGQPLTLGHGRALPVHASTSGIIRAIEPRPVAHPAGLHELCVILEVDHQDSWYKRTTFADYLQHTPETLIQHIHQSGIAGLGGAGFPTGNKLQGGLQRIETLIINAAECEPYITADDRLMQERAKEIILGIEILCHILSPRTTLIGIEDNKPQAISALNQALAARDPEIAQHNPIILRVIPTKYPSGGAKQLTKILTGKEVPYGQRSSSIGVLMQNVGTVFAIKRAVIDGEPLIERVVTLTGEAIRSPGNLWVRLGTPISHVLEYVGFQSAEENMVIMGGPLMGFTLPSLDIPAVKMTNCILAPTSNEMDPTAEEQACIRCGNCTEACPSGLLPQQLYWFSLGKQHDKARAYHIADCIECGACAYVCPSNIPLVQYYRQEKADIWAIDEEKKRANQAKQHFEAKQIRLEREKNARAERHRQATVQPATDAHNTIQAALVRVREKQSQQISMTAPPPTGELHIQRVGALLPDNSAVIAAREKRKMQARLYKEQQAQSASEIAINTETSSATEEDPRKAAVAAAIARAKAHKAAQQNDAVASEVIEKATPAEPVVEDDPRKAAVAAAIARAKARKAAQQNSAVASEVIEKATPAESVVEDDPRKAAVAAAIARAKARKAAQQEQANNAR